MNNIVEYTRSNIDSKPQNEFSQNYDSFYKQSVQFLPANSNQKYQGYMKQNYQKQHPKEDYYDSLYYDSKTQQIRVANLLPDQEPQISSKRSLHFNMKKYQFNKDKFFKKNNYKICSSSKKKYKEKNQKVELILNKYRNLVKSIEKPAISEADQ